MRELLRRLSDHPRLAAELLLASLFANLLALAVPLFVIQVLNRYVSYGVDATLSTLTVGVCIAVALEFAFRRVRLRLAAEGLGGPDERRANAAFAHLVEAKRAALDTLPVGGRRDALRGLDTVESAFSAPNLAAILDLPFTLLFLVALALLAPTLGLIGAAFLIALFALGLLHRRRLREPTRGVAERAALGDTLISTLDEGADTLRVFNGGEWLRRHWREHGAKLRGLRRRIALDQGRFQALTQAAQGLQGVTIIAVGATLVVAGELDVGALIGANLLAARALAPVIQFGRLGELFAQADRRLEGIAALEALPTESASGKGEEGPADYRGALELRDLAFAHPGAVTPLFESLSLALEPGGVLMVTGRNGTGKTTLARLITGLIDPSRGQLLVDGVELRQLPPAWWRRRLIYLPQEPRFLPGTIRANLLAANPDLDDAALAELIGRVGLERTLAESPQGLDTPIAMDGRPLALGLRKRLALARALAGDGPLAILDEPSDGLDEEGRTHLYTVLKELAESGRTLIVITHDPNLLRGATRVLDLNTKPVPTLHRREGEAP